MTEPTPDTASDAADVVLDSEHTTDTHPSHEAAKYRVRLREAEGEIAQLTEQLAAAQRGQIDALVGAQIPTDTFWKVTDPADLLDESGLVDPERVRGEVARVRQELGAVKPVARGGFVSGAQSGAPTKAPSFADAFAPPKG